MRLSSAIPYESRPYVTVPELRKWLGLGKKAVESKIASGAYTVVLDGNRRKVNTKSVIADLDRESRNDQAA